MNTQKRRINRNIILCMMVSAIALLFLAASFWIEDPSSAIFPRVLCVLALLLSAGYFIQILKGQHEDDFDFTGTGRAIKMGVMMSGYVLLNYLFGYYVSTVIFLPVSMVFLGQRNWKVIAAVSAGMPLTIYLLMDLLMDMLMPEAMLTTLL